MTEPTTNRDWHTVIAEIVDNEFSSAPGLRQSVADRIVERVIDALGLHNQPTTAPADTADLRAVILDELKSTAVRIAAPLPTLVVQNLERAADQIATALTAAGWPHTPPPPHPTDLDLDAIEHKWLRMCGHCDAGITANCVCPTEDPRGIIAKLVEALRGWPHTHQPDNPHIEAARQARAEADQLRAELAHVRSGAELIEFKRSAWANAESLAKTLEALTAAEAERDEAVTQHQQLRNGIDRLRAGLASLGWDIALHDDINPITVALDKLQQTETFRNQMTEALDELSSARRHSDPQPAGGQPDA